MSNINGFTHNENNGSNNDYRRNDFLVNLFDINTAKEWHNSLENLLYFMVMNCEEDTQVSEIRRFYSDVYLIKEEFRKVI